MAATLKLAEQLNTPQLNLAEKLRQNLEEQRATRRKVQEEEIARQIKQVPTISNSLIAGLPSFLEDMASQGERKAYIICRSLCTPDENLFPNFTEANISDFQKQNLSEYMIRRSMRGIIQRVAFWGKKQGFKVGIGKIASHDRDHW